MRQSVLVQDVEQELERIEEEQKEAEKNNPFLGLSDQPEEPEEGVGNKGKAEE